MKKFELTLGHSSQDEYKESKKEVKSESSGDEEEDPGDKLSEQSKRDVVLSNIFEYSEKVTVQPEKKRETQFVIE